MPEENKQVKYDVDGYDIITNAIKDLLNQYPGLLPEETFLFSTLEEDSGLSFYPVSGSVVVTETESITGRVNQVCSYPFYIVYRTASTSENSKKDVKEFLDSVGKWIEKQPITVDGETYKIEKYPVLTEGRVIEEIARQTPAYPEEPQENGVQDWVISIALQYRNIFYR